MKMSPSSAENTTTTTPDTAEVGERLSSMSVCDAGPEVEDSIPQIYIKEEDTSDVESSSSNARTPSSHSRPSSAAMYMDGHLFRHSFMNSSMIELQKAADKIEPYEIRSEKEHLKLPFHSELFQNDVALTRDMMDDLGQRITDSKFSSEHSERFNQIADKINKLRDTMSDTFTIGIIGGEHSGKSSLINSLLHIPDIAPVGGIERHRTNIVTEYHYTTKDRTCPILVMAEAMSEPEVKAELCLLVQALRSTDQSLSERTANYLIHIFWGNGPFTGFSDATIQEVIRTVTIEQLLEYWKNKSPLHAWERCGWRREFNDPQEAFRAINSFHIKRSWPWIKSIKYFVNADILKDGLVIADVPIYKEYNSPVLGACTLKYLRSCKRILLSSTALQLIPTLSNCKERLDSVSAYKIDIVCTQSDQVDIKEVRQLVLKDAKPTQQKELEELEEQIAIQQVQRNEPELKVAKQRQLQFLLNFRNELFRNKLMQEPLFYGLFIILVSNTKYSKYCENVSRRCIADTGVPALRHYLRQLLAEFRFTVYQKKYLSALDDIIYDIKDRVLEEEKNKIDNTLEALRKIRAMISKLASEIVKMAADTRQKLSSEISSSISSFKEQHEGRRAIHALQVGRRWQKQYLNNGSDHNCLDNVSWNKSILRAINKSDLAKILAQYQNSVQSCVTELQKNLLDRVNTVFTGRYVPEALKSQVIATLDIHNPVFTSKAKAINQVTSDIYKKIFKVDQSSYIWPRMDMVYRSALLSVNSHIPRAALSEIMVESVRAESPCAMVLGAALRDLEACLAHEEMHLRTMCLNVLAVPKFLVEIHIKKCTEDTSDTDPAIQYLNGQLAKVKAISARLKTMEA